MAGDIAPKEGEFLEGKLWFHRRLSNVTLGLTLAAIDEIGAVEGVDFPSEGDDFEKGDVVATVSGTNGSLEVVAPASGFIKEVNEALHEAPDVVSEDPLEEGWLVKLEVQDTAELKEYASAIEEDD